MSPNGREEGGEDGQSTSRLVKLKPSRGGVDQEFKIRREEAA